MWEHQSVPGQGFCWQERGYASGSEEQWGGGLFPDSAVQLLTQARPAFSLQTCLLISTREGWPRAWGFHLVPCRPCISWRGWDWGWPWLGRGWKDFRIGGLSRYDFRASTHFSFGFWTLAKDFIIRNSVL